MSKMGIFSYLYRPFIKQSVCGVMTERGVAKDSNIILERFNFD